MKQDYSSPRWSMEIQDCSMPMTFDTYSRCSYNCLYCFSFFQKSHTVDGYLTGDVRSVNPKKVIAIFEAAEGRGEIKGRNNAQFFPLIRDRRIMQWGGLADQFDEYERRNGITLELLEYFDRIDYPLSFSTKATWWTQDERYMTLFARHSHNWHVKISIITADDAKAVKMEKGVPTSTERLAAVKRLADAGIHVTLRLRPYIVGMSEDYEALIHAAADAGADSVTTEFFCMETRADARLKARYAAMSQIVGFDIYDFYRKHSPQNGYRRLTRNVKVPIAEKMREAAHRRGMRFHASDAHLRDFNDACNCCGVPPEWGCSCTGHIGEAVMIAQKKGIVTYSDIEAQRARYFSFPWIETASFNTGNNRARAIYYDTTMAQWLRQMWNDTDRGGGVTKGYGGVLEPAGHDERGDLVFRYAGRGGRNA